ACRRDVSHGGDVAAAVTSATAAAYRGHRSASSSFTSSRSDWPTGTDASAILAPLAADGRVSGLSYAVATSRAGPRTLRQSGRLAVTSKSMTPSGILGPPDRCQGGGTIEFTGSTDATSNPRRASFAAISSGEAERSTKSRSQETRRRIYSGN